MFSSLLDAVPPIHSRPASAPPVRGLPSAFFHPSMLAASLHSPHSLTSLSAAAAPRAHRNSRNSVSFLLLIHGPLHTPGGESALPTYPSSARSRIGSSSRFLAPALEHFSTAIPFRIRTSGTPANNSRRINTSKTKDLKFFRMNTYEKPGRGAPVRSHSPSSSFPSTNPS